MKFLERIFDKIWEIVGVEEKETESPWVRFERVRQSKLGKSVRFMSQVDQHTLITLFSHIGYNCLTEEQFNVHRLIHADLTDGDELGGKVRGEVVSTIIDCIKDEPMWANHVIRAIGILGNPENGVMTHSYWNIIMMTIESKLRKI